MPLNKETKPRASTQKKQKKPQMIDAGAQDNEQKVKILIRN